MIIPNNFSKTVNFFSKFYVWWYHVYNVLITAEVSYNAYANTLGVVSRCMRASIVPTATLVNVAVFANEEIITNVPPAPIVHMKVLIRSDDRGARLLIPTVVTCTAVMDHHIRCWCHRHYFEIATVPGFPFVSADDSRTLWGI